jgi:hypothetical protein
VVWADLADLFGLAAVMWETAVILVMFPRQAEGALDEGSAVVGVMVLFAAPFAHSCKEARLLYSPLNMFETLGLFAGVAIVVSEAT